MMCYHLRPTMELSGTSFRLDEPTAASLGVCRGRQVMFWGLSLPLCSTFGLATTIHLV